MKWFSRYFRLKFWWITIPVQFHRGKFALISQRMIFKKYRDHILNANNLVSIRIPISHYIALRIKRLNKLAENYCIWSWNCMKFWNSPHHSYFATSTHKVEKCLDKNHLTAVLLKKKNHLTGRLMSSNFITNFQNGVFLV